MDAEPNDATQASYDRVAREYAERISGELAHKPFDRQVLDRFAARLCGRGVICDLGCGPGHVARYLSDRGAAVEGVDLSPEMVRQARALNPGMVFRQGDMRALDVPDGAWAGAAALYSLIHIPRSQVVTVLREIRRALQPGGLLLLAFHLGNHSVRLEEWWGHKVSVEFVFFESAEMAGYLEAAGFHLEELSERAPYRDVEYQSRRGCILAVKPGAEGR